MIKFIKHIIIDLFFVAIYLILYKTLGFEPTVIVALAQICSHLVQSKVSNATPSVHTIYSPQKNKVKF